MNLVATGLLDTSEHVDHAGSVLLHRYGYPGTVEVLLLETASEFGDQRIYASHKSIMFSRKTCYFFVRPKQKHLELCVFLGRTIRAPQVKRAEPSSKAKIYHIIRVTHRDEVEPPITDWLQEAYEFCGAEPGKAAAAGGTRPKAAAKKKLPKKKKAARPARAPRRTAKRRSSRS